MWLGCIPLFWNSVIIQLIKYANTLTWESWLFPYIILFVKTNLFQKNNITLIHIYKYCNDADHLKFLQFSGQIFCCHLGKMPSFCKMWFSHSWCLGVETVVVLQVQMGSRDVGEMAIEQNKTILLYNMWFITELGGLKDSNLEVWIGYIFGKWFSLLL